MRLVLALYGHNTVRLRPSAPTASLILRILSRHAAAGAGPRAAGDLSPYPRRSSFRAQLTFIG